MFLEKATRLLQSECSLLRLARTYKKRGAKASSVLAGSTATPQRGRGEITASPRGEKEREGGRGADKLQ